MYPIHPYADLFPIHDGVALTDLAEDILTHGQREPILTYQGQVLDGRRRQLACGLVHVEPTYREFTGTVQEALALVVSLNLHRRHLSDTESQTTVCKPWTH